MPTEEETVETPVKKTRAKQKKLKTSTENGSRHKNFGDALRIADLEPLSFDLCGMTFHCRPALQSKKLLYFVKKASESSGATAGDALHEFMESVIYPDDLDSWKEIVDGDEYVVDSSMVGDIVTWLVEQYSSRPTQQQSPSSSGQTTTSPGSEDEV